MQKPDDVVEMIVVGLVVDPATNSPILILKDINSDACLPIWIGPSEATSIALVLKGIGSNRPLTHDLYKSTIEMLGAKIISVAIVSLIDDTFLSEIELIIGEECKFIDARPSDSIALALRFNAPIFVSRDVLEKSKSIIVPIGNVEDKLDDGNFQIEVVHEELNDTNFNNAFNKFSEKDWLERFESLDPTDFKYKI